MIATTLNIHVEVLSKIAETAAQLKKSRREIIVQLLMRLMRDAEISYHRFSAVSYQRKDMKENWKCFHIRFKENEYEYFIDLRKLYKFSVSCLVSIAVKKYLGELLGTESKAVDNYSSYTNYILHGEEIDGIITCSFYWGVQKKRYIRKLLRRNQQHPDSQYC